MLAESKIYITDPFSIRQYFLGTLIYEKSRHIEISISLNSNYMGPKSNSQPRSADGASFCTGIVCTEESSCLSGSVSLGDILNMINKRKLLFKKVCPDWTDIKNKPLAGVIFLAFGSKKANDRFFLTDLTKGCANSFRTDHLSR